MSKPRFSLASSILFILWTDDYKPSGALFLLSKWYTRYAAIWYLFSHVMMYLTGREELGLRTALFYCGNLMSNAFGGLLAAGILNGMGGKLGQVAWR